MLTSYIFSQSKLTSLLQEELGGNCRTKVLMCMKSNTNGALANIVVSMSNQFVQILNFPVRNNIYLQVRFL